MSKAHFSIVAMLLLFVLGCGTDPSTDQTNAGKSNKIPRLDFHKPDSYQDAIVRMQEIMEAVSGEAVLPEPKSFDVVEEVHGNHSHYYLKSEYEAGQRADKGHKGVKSELVDHQVKVDVFQEMRDIARWLPNIASNEDFSKSKWDSVKSDSNQLRDLLEDALESKDPGPRSFIQENQEAIGDLVASLKSKATDKGSSE